MRIALLYASAGQGHQKAAESLGEAFKACGIPNEEIFLGDSLDDTPPWFKTLYTSIYFYSVKYTPRLWGASYDWAENSFLYQRFIGPFRRLLNSGVAEKLVRRIKAMNPDAVVCTHFLAPELLGRLKVSGFISSFLLSVVTDFVPHAFWINSGTDHYWVMSEEGKQILERRGIPSTRITAGGIPISLRFKPQGKKREFRKKEGLREDLFTLLLTSGSFGLGPTVEVLEALSDFGDKIQALVVCGRNQDLLQTLEAKRFPFHAKLYGFVSHMDELMEASDLMVAKPGGITTSESLAKGLPMVVLNPIPGQEAGNARLLKERNAAFFLGEPGDIRTIVKGILDYPEVLVEKQREIERLAKPDAALEIARFVLNRIKKRT